MLVLVSDGAGDAESAVAGFAQIYGGAAQGLSY